MAEKVPPHDIEAERLVLGSILLDKEALIKIADFLQAEHFYEPSHGTIFTAVMELFLKGSAIDIVTASRQLTKQKKLKDIGGRAYLAQLLENVPTAAHVEEYAHMVKEFALRRGLITAAGVIGELAVDDSQGTSDVLNKAQAALFNVSVAGIERGFVHIRTLLEQVYEEAADMAAQEGTIRGVPSGFTDLDKLLGGFQKSDLIILAARPSMGKTALALDMSLHAAVAEKKKVAFFSLEMSRLQLMKRLLSMQAKVSLWGMSNGGLNENEFARLAEAVGQLSETNIFIDDRPGQNIVELKTKARRLYLEQQIDLVVVDYLQLIHANTRDGRVQEVSQISQELKNIARELDVPVIALSQLSRRVEERQDRMPQLSDLRDSGSIEQDADIVMFVHREEYYNAETPRLGVADIKIAKHRNGPVGDLELAWVKEQASFGNLLKQQAPAEEE